MNPKEQEQVRAHLAQLVMARQAKAIFRAGIEWYTPLAYSYYILN